MPAKLPRSDLPLEVCAATPPRVPGAKVVPGRGAGQAVLAGDLVPILEEGCATKAAGLVRRGEHPLCARQP